MIQTCRSFGNWAIWLLLVLSPLTAAGAATSVLIATNFRSGWLTFLEVMVEYWIVFSVALLCLSILRSWLHIKVSQSNRDKKDRFISFLDLEGRKYCFAENILVFGFAWLVAFRTYFSLIFFLVMAVWLAKRKGLDWGWRQTGYMVLLLLFPSFVSMFSDLILILEVK